MAIFKSGSGSMIEMTEEQANEINRRLFLEEVYERYEEDEEEEARPLGREEDRTRGRVPEPRRAIQISIADSSDRVVPVICALCNDGTIWRYRTVNGDPVWERLKSIPQEEP